MAVKYNSRQYKNTTKVTQVVTCAKNGSVKVAPGQTVTLYDLKAESDAHGTTLQDYQGDALNLTSDGKMQVVGEINIGEITGEVTVVQKEKDRTITGDVAVEPSAGAEFTVVQKSAARTVAGTVAVSGVSGTVEVKPKAAEKFTVVQDAKDRTVTGTVSISGNVTVDQSAKDRTVTGTVTARPEKSTEQNMFHTASAAKMLTGAYVAGDTIDLDSKYGVLHLFCQYTTGAAEAANSVQVKIEVRRDGNANWHQLSNNDASLSLMEYSFTQVSAATVTDNFTIAVPIGPCDDVRVSAKETGVAANFGTLLVVGVLGW